MVYDVARGYLLLFFPPVSKVRCALQGVFGNTALLFCFAARRKAPAHR